VQQIWIAPINLHGRDADPVDRPQPDAAHRSLDEHIEARVGHESGPISSKEKKNSRPFPIAPSSRAQIVPRHGYEPSKLRPNTKKMRMTRGWNGRRTETIPALARKDMMAARPCRFRPRLIGTMIGAIHGLNVCGIATMYAKQPPRCTHASPHL